MKPNDYEQLWSELPTLLFVPLSKGKFTVIDSDDGYLSLTKWHFDGDGYAAGSHHSRLHRIILKTPQGKFSDHKNRDRLDNRRRNLRVATRQENSFNQGPRSRTGFKGVRKDRSCKCVFRAVVCVNKRRIYVGQSAVVEEAARIYDLHALKHQGEFASLNFPERRSEYQEELAKGTADTIPA
jgi:hypothetical protein